MTSDALEEIFREQWARLLALLVGQFRRLDLAEEGLSEAFLAATSHWPVDGMPTNPAAWLLTTARRTILDRLRREATAARKEPLLVVEAEVQQQSAAVLADPGDGVRDERLRLIFLCAHPALAREAAAALTLRLVLGVPLSDLAAVFGVNEAAMAARLTRAKRQLARVGGQFAVPEGAELDPRLGTVCRVVYLGFTVGYAPATGRQATRVEVAGEAIRLARLIRTLLPQRPEPVPMLALMLLQHARRDTRTDPDGHLVLLPDQDRAAWRHEEIDDALSLLEPMMTGAWTGITAEYFLQALIAAEHAVAPTAADTHWDRIAALYAELEALTGSPVVRLNRAVAVAEAEGPAAGLALLDGLAEVLPRSHRLAGVRGVLLAEIGRVAEAKAALQQALALCRNEVEAEHLRGRLAALV